VRKVVAALAALAAIVLVVAAVVLSQGPSGAKGGVRAEYKVVPADGKAPSAQVLADIRAIVERRAIASGIEKPTVAATSPDRILLDLPGLSHADSSGRLVEPIGDLAFVPLGQGRFLEGQRLDVSAYPQLLGGQEVQSIVVRRDNGYALVAVELTALGRQRLAEWTAIHVGDSLGIVLDGTVVSAPQIQTPIPSGELLLTFGQDDPFTLERARSFVAVVSSGPLPMPLVEVSSQVVATFGA